MARSSRSLWTSVLKRHDGVPAANDDDESREMALMERPNASTQLLVGVVVRSSLTSARVSTVGSV